MVSFNIATPFPGTEMFSWAEKNNYLIHKDWAEYNLAKTGNGIADHFF